MYAWLTLRRIRETIVAVEKCKYYIFWVCLCVYARVRAFCVCVCVLVRGRVGVSMCVRMRSLACPT